MANISYQGTATSTPDPGIASTETNFDIKGYRQRMDDPRIYKTDDESTKIGFWSGFDKSVTGTIDGEVASALASIPPVKLAGTGTITVANVFTMDDISAGGLYHESSEVTQSEGAIATFTCTFTRHPNIA